MAKKAYDGAIVRCNSTSEQYEILQISEDQILVSPVDSVEDENNVLPGFWDDPDNFEIQVCKQHGSGHGTYMSWTTITL